MFKYLLCFTLPFFSAAQVKVFFPKIGNKEHERAIFSLPNAQILSGSSSAVVRLHSHEGAVLQTQELATSFKEIRDLTTTNTGYIAMQSNDTSALVLLSNNLEIDTVVYPLGGKNAHTDHPRSV